jgi:DNA-binding response OmpR family regulator
LFLGDFFLAPELLIKNVSEKTAAVKIVLIVDDEELFLKSVADGLKPYEKKHKFRILTAANGNEALKHFKANEIALLVTDLRMPEMDGITLITHVHNQYPAVPVIVMTAFGSPQIEKQIKEMGILHYLEKPISFEEFRDHVLHELSQKKKGRIEGITLASFLQLIWMEKMTCTLIVKSMEKTGVLSIKNGELKNAECGEERGMDTALAILAWENVTIEMEESYIPGGETLNATIEEILLESFRRQDEQKNAPQLEIEYADIELSDNIIRIKKEERMNVQKLNKAIEILKESMGGALMATDIWGSADMQSIAGFNSQPAATALFGQIIVSTNRALKDSGFPMLGKYCVFDLVDGKMVVLIPMGDYAWGMLVDGKKAQLGLLLNVALPKAIAAFEDAITS